MSRAQLGYEAIASALVDAGIDTLFGVMGDGNMDLIGHWTHDRALRYVAARHESGAVAMASAYASVTAGPGACTVTQGPGLTNALTALTTAAKAKASIILISGDVPVGRRRHDEQAVDQRGVVAPSGALFVDLDSAMDARTALDQAIRVRGRPVVLNAGTDVQRSPWHAVARVAPPPAADVSLDDAAVREVAERLVDARRPVLLAGRGAVRSGARAAITLLAEHLGAVLVTSLKAKDLFLGHPLNAGIAGGFAAPPVRAMLGGADCLVAFGAGLNAATMMDGRLFPQARIAHCDLAASAIGTNTPVDTALVGDARMVAEALLDAVVRINTGVRPGRVEIEAAVARSLADSWPAGTRSTAQRALAILDEVLPRDRTLVLDAGHFMGYASTSLAVPAPDFFVWTADFGSIGLGLGAAVGAACARPDRPTVLLVGDGGLSMGLPELETIGRDRLPVLVVVLNDGAYGAEVHLLRHRGWPAQTALFDNPDFTLLAEALGIRAVRAQAPFDGLRQLAGHDLARDGPLLVDVRLPFDEVADWFAARMLG